MNIQFCIASAFQCIFLLLACYGANVRSSHSSFLGKDYAIVVKALCCFSVILSHSGRGERYALLGCAHFIAVTFFFFFSGYGLSFSLKTKPKYLASFYKRIMSVLIPYCIVRMSMYALHVENTCGLDYVNVILLFYMVYYLCHRFVKWKPDAVMIAFIVFYSLSMQFYGQNIKTYVSIHLLDHIGWESQSLGFAYGILLFHFFDTFCNALERYARSIATFCLCLFVPAFILYLRIRNIYTVSWSEYALRIVIVALCMMLFFVETIHVRLGNPIILFLGKHSYATFLMQGMVIPLAHRYVANASPALFVIGVVIASFTFGILFDVLLSAGRRFLMNGFSSRRAAR